MSIGFLNYYRGKVVYGMLAAFLVVGLVACAGTPKQPGGSVVNPGDKISDFLITTGNQDDLAFTHNQECSKQGNEEKYRCEIPIGKTVNIANGIYDSQYSGKLDEIWANHTYEMTINDRPVNLQAFGSIDYQHPLVGMMRHWNIVVSADKPGEITVHSKSTVGGNPFEDTTTYVFTAQ